MRKGIPLLKSPGVEQETIYITRATHISIRPKTKGPGKDLEFLSSMLNELNTAQIYETKSTLYYKVEIIFEIFKRTPYPCNVNTQLIHYYTRSKNYTRTFAKFVTFLVGSYESAMTTSC